MTRDEAINVLRQSKRLWTDRQIQWFYNHANRREWAEQWIAALAPYPQAAALQTLAALGKRINPFNGRWEFVGQHIAAHTHTHLKKVCVCERPNKPATKSEPPTTSAREQLREILALEARGVAHEEAVRQVLSG